jgi:hypothetical protein
LHVPAGSDNAIADRVITESGVRVT